MFKIGDVVEITEESSATTLLDFVEGDGYKVIDVYTFSSPQIKLRDGGGKIGWLASSHFKLKEDIIVEKKECLFKEGQVVWDLRSGRGVVEEITNDERYPVKVRFDLKDMDGDGIIDSYTEDGRYVHTQTIRSLYFSEPKIEAATEPLFEPALKEGDIVVVKHVKQDWKHLLQVRFEDEDAVWVSGEEDGYLKSAWNFYKLGEKINFK